MKLNPAPKPKPQTSTLSSESLLQNVAAGPQEQWRNRQHSNKQHSSSSVPTAIAVVLAVGGTWKCCCCCWLEAAASHVVYGSLHVEGLDGISLIVGTLTAAAGASRGVGDHSSSSRHSTHSNRNNIDIVSIIGGALSRTFEVHQSESTVWQ